MDHGGKEIAIRTQIADIVLSIYMVIILRYLSGRELNSLRTSDKCMHFLVFKTKLPLFFMTLLWIFVWCPHLNAAESNAFTLSGEFINTFAGKQHDSGSFRISAFGSNALVDVLHANGFREIVGTDGKDNFRYIPASADLAASTNGNGQAFVYSGRFPTDAGLFAQFLWIMNTRDSTLLTNLNSLRFPFYVDYKPEEITLRLTNYDNISNMVDSIRWYAPNKVAYGTNRYRNAIYTNGWLLAECAVSGRQPVGNMALPIKIIYTQYQMRSVKAGPVDLSELRPRPPEDVLPIEIAEFAITRASNEKPRNTYIPEIPDNTARVIDYRNPKPIVVRITSGKWWTVGSALRGYELSIYHRRIAILFLISISLGFPIYVLLKKRGLGK